MDGTYERVKKVVLEQLLVDAESILTVQGAVDYIDSHAADLVTDPTVQWRSSNLSTPMTTSKGRRPRGVRNRMERPVSISAVVPAFNEETTVAWVVESLLQCERIDEIVCVNDGSTDRTLEVLRLFGDRITLVDLQPNRGKGHALAEGMRQANGDIVAFFDADLTNLTTEHIETLLAPITRGGARAVLGSPGGDFFTSVASALAPRVADSIGSTFTGERAYFRQDLLPHAARMEATRFGVEVYLNGEFARTDTVIVPLPRLTGLGKQHKHGWSLAVKEYSGEVFEVAREITRRSWARLG